jgi:hypothetical protein
VALYLPSLTEHEARQAQIKAGIKYLLRMGALEGLAESDLKKIKQMLDIEYLFYYTAMVALTEGREDDYQAYLGLAARELDHVTQLIQSAVKPHKRSFASPPDF